jgi:hypothetical protein
MFLIQRLFPSVKDFFASLQIPAALDRAITAIKVPESTLGRCLFCFSSELLSFFIVATNFRALAKGFIVWTVVTDGLIVLSKHHCQQDFHREREDAQRSVHSVIHAWRYVWFCAIHSDDSVYLGKLMTPSERLHALAEAQANSPENMHDVLRQAMQGSCCRLGVHELKTVGVFRMRQGGMVFGSRQECTLCEFKSESRY